MCLVFSSVCQNLLFFWVRVGAMGRSGMLVSGSGQVPVFLSRAVLVSGSSLINKFSATSAATDCGSLLHPLQQTVETSLLVSLL